MARKASENIYWLSHADKARALEWVCEFFVPDSNEISNVDAELPDFDYPSLV